MNRVTPLIAAAFALGSTPALAGNLAPPANDTTVIAPAPVSFATPDWTGFYGGAQLGYNSLNSNIAGNDDAIIGGFIGGYDYDFGNYVLGAGLDYDFTDAEVSTAPNPSVTLENIFRAKVRGGYKIGSGLIYGTGGYAHAETDNLGGEDGYFIGAGYETMVTESFSLGGEVLYHEFDNFNGSNADVEPTTVQLRGTFRF